MYLFVLATYIVGSQITSSFYVNQDFLTISNTVKLSGTLYKIGLAIELIASLSTILLAGAFYALLRTSRPNLALFALLWRAAGAIFGVMAVAVSFAAMQNYAGSTASSIEDRMILANVLSDAKSTIFYISIIFFSLSSTLTFAPLYRSELLPKLMSAFGIFASLLAGCLAFIYLTNPILSQSLTYAWAPIFAIEVITGIWLLWRGGNHSSDNVRSG